MSVYNNDSWALLTGTKEAPLIGHHSPTTQSMHAFLTTVFKAHHSQVPTTFLPWLLLSPKLLDTVCVGHAQTRLCRSLPQHLFPRVPPPPTAGRAGGDELQFFLIQIWFSDDASYHKITCSSFSHFSSLLPSKTAILTELGLR